MEKQKRKSANFKTNVVMELLRGETIEALSRKHGLTMAELSGWNIFNQKNTTQRIHITIHGCVRKACIIRFDIG